MKNRLTILSCFGITIVVLIVLAVYLSRSGNRAKKLTAADLTLGTFVELGHFSKKGETFATDDPRVVERVKEIVISDEGSFEDAEMKNEVPLPYICLHTGIDSANWKKIGKVLFFDPDQISSGKYGKDFQQLLDSITSRKEGWNIYFMRADGVSEKDIQEFKQSHPLD